MPTTIDVDFSAARGAYAIVASRFNALITERLVDAAVQTLVRHGVDPDAITIVWVPGAWELPLVAQRVCASRRFVGVVALGCVIRGGTPHFGYVAGEAAKGLAAVQRETGTPVGFGVLTVDSIEQALERAGTKMGNKGAEAALAVLETVAVLARLGEG